MADVSIPTISRKLADETLIELVHDAGAGTTALAVATPDGEVSVQSRIGLPDGETLIPYGATNTLLASGCVLLPSAIGEYHGKSVLVSDLKAFLHRHVDLSPLFEEIAAHYILFSWVHDAFNEAPMLRLRGDFGSGKTRRSWPSVHSAIRRSSHRVRRLSRRFFIFSTRSRAHSSSMKPTCGCRMRLPTS